MKSCPIFFWFRGVDVRISEMSALIPTCICPEQQAASHWEEGGGWVEAAATVPFCRGSLMSVGVPFSTLEPQTPVL